MKLSTVGGMAKPPGPADEDRSAPVQFTRAKNSWTGIPGVTATVERSEGA